MRSLHIMQSMLNSHDSVSGFGGVILAPEAVAIEFCDFFSGCFEEHMEQKPSNFR